MAISPWKIQPNTKDLSTPWIQPVNEWQDTQLEEQKMYQRERPIQEMQNKFDRGEIGYQQANDWFTNQKPIFQKEQQNLRNIQGTVTSNWRQSVTNNTQTQYDTNQIDYPTYIQKMNEILAWYPEDSAQYGEAVSKFAETYNQVLEEMEKEQAAIGGESYVQWTAFLAKKRAEGFNVKNPNIEYTYTPAPKEETPSGNTGTGNTGDQNTGTTPGTPAPQPVNPAPGSIEKIVTKAVKKALKAVSPKPGGKKKKKNK